MHVGSNNLDLFVLTSWDDDPRVGHSQTPTLVEPFPRRNAILQNIE